MRRKLNRAKIARRQHRENLAWTAQTERLARDERAQAKAIREYERNQRILNAK